ncbi:hypothetical protein RB195_026057 [Necator americanus]|uniref:PKD/REJ-like domain-containing protein n=1 Tax=Necator americanus TaxID=51031 RepID=A0ABR1EV48_NECAM
MNCGGEIAYEHGPAIRNESSLITADDLPSENVLVSVDKLVSKILIPEEGSVYGLVVLEAGDSSYVEWELSSSSSLSSSFPIVFSYESYPPIVEESFVRGLPIYHFSAAAYQGTPPEVIVVGPGAFLSVVHKSLNASNTPCYNAALIVAPLKWTADVAQAFTQQFSRVVVRECTDCTRLPLSSDFIRLCPISRSEADISAPVNVTIGPVVPTFWDVSSDSQLFEAALNISEGNSEIDQANCSLLSNNETFYPLNVELPFKSILRMSLSQKMDPDVFWLICSFSITGRIGVVGANYTQKIEGINYIPLVEIEQGSIVLPCQKIATNIEVKFKKSLPNILSDWNENGSYCSIDNVSYPCNVTDLTMICDLGSLTLSRDMDAYFVRSRALHNVTMREQVPMRLQFTCTQTSPLPVSPILRATMSRDLLGIVIESSSQDLFPVGLVPCSEVILEHTSLGKDAVCVGDGENMAVKFGDAATLNISDTLTVLGYRFRLDKPEIVNRPNFTVFAPSEVMACMENVAVEVKQITGDGRRSLRYRWQAENASAELTTLFAEAVGRSVSFPSNLLDSETVVIVTGCNFVNICTTSEAIRLRPVTSDATLSLTLAGVSHSLVPSMAVRLRALPELTRCNASLTFVPNDAQYNWYLDGVFVTNDDSYRIPAYTYQAGDTVEVLIEVNYKDSTTNQHLKAIAQEMFNYVAEKLVATVDAVSRSVASDAPVIVDASGSNNPNDRDGSVTHEWLCWNMTSMAKCNLPTTIETKSPILRIHPGQLDKGMSFNFSDKISAQNLSSIVWSVVTIGPLKLPQISFSSFKMDKVSTGDYVRIQAYVTVQRGWLNTTWEMSDSNQAAVSLTIPPADPLLYPNWTGLQPGMMYIVRLNAYSVDGNSYADVQIFVNAPPTPGLVEVVPAKGASALNTQIEFRVGDGWVDEDQPLEYRFGLKVLYVDNTTENYWFPHAGASSYRMYLPSAQSDYPSCGKRVGFQGLLEVCDLYSSCSKAESETFEVAPPANLTVAVVDMVAAINSDVGNGNIFSALSNMYALDVQKCEEDLDVVTADKITTKLLMTLDEDSDSNDYKEVLASASRLMNIVTPPVLEALTLVLEHYRSLLGLTSTTTSSRTKRAATTTTATNEQEATDMLKMYDMLMTKNQPIVEVYLLNIQDFLGTFCIQLDKSSSRVMAAQGNGYTLIQAQSLVPGSKNFSTSSYTIAGEYAKVITFSNEFAARFASWHCGPSFVVCQNICLATSQIKKTILFKNDQLMEHLFGNTYEAVSINKSASQIYQVQFLDPLSGASVHLPPNIIQYSVYIPLTNYQPSNYYACLLFIGKAWDESKCLASSFAKNFDGADHIQCRCSSPGILSVFITAPPVPVALPDHNEIRMTFHLSIGTVPTATQQSLFISRLAAASRVDDKRLVNQSVVAGSGNSSQIWITLRPPFRVNQMTNSYAVQAIQRAVQSESGFKAYDSITVIKSNYSVIKRDLNGDGNARKVIITIYRSFQNVVGNDTTAIINKWCESIANMLRVSNYRFKNARIYLGIIFNLTITLPFEEETTPLSAEEIAIMMMECSMYQEFDLQSNQGETLPMEKITSSDIIELIVDRLISTGLALSSLYIGGAVVVKVRTDRLVEEERRRMVRIEPAQPPPPPPVPPPQYTQAVVPVPTLRERYPDHRLRNVTKTHHA